MAAIFCLPEEEFSHLSIQFDEDSNLASVIVNTSLIDFEYKEYFGWECVVKYDYEPGEDGLPKDDEEFDRVNDFFDRLDALLVHDEEHPNALFFVRILDNGEAECVWMLNNPDPAAEALGQLLDGGDYELEFGYSIDNDKEWENYSYFLQKENVKE